MNKIKAGSGLLRSRFLGKRLPLFVGIRLTNRCNLDCKYCYLPKYRDELTTEELFGLIDNLKQAGCVSINYTGGEPLLRSDIKEIIDYTVEKGIEANITTNGTLLKKRFEDIKNACSVTISLDGSESENKDSRKNSKTKDIIKNIDILKKNKMKVRISCVLSKYNTKNIENVLSFFRKMDVPVSFQPAYDYFNGSKDVSYFYPNKKDYDNAIDMIVLWKKNNFLKVSNSYPNLRHLKNWPNLAPIRCAAGKVRCRIEANGDIYPCNRINNKNDYFNLKEVGFEKAFESMPIPKCDGCWCANHVEMNLLYSLDINTIINNIDR